MLISDYTLDLSRICLWLLSNPKGNYFFWMQILSLLKINSLILRARCTILGNIPGTHIFESIHICKEAREYKHIKIIRYEESVYYVNVDNFKYKVIKLTGINPELVLQKIDADCDKLFKKLEKDVLKQKKMNKTNSFIGEKMFDRIKILFKINNSSDIPNLDKYVLDKVKLLVKLYHLLMKNKLSFFLRYQITIEWINRYHRNQNKNKRKSSKS